MYVIYILKNVIKRIESYKNNQNPGIETIKIVFRYFAIFPRNTGSDLTEKNK